jgi:hypothetical protein
MSKEVGGLRVRRIKEFNSALLGKRSWRLLVDKESLWFRVLSARYGVGGGQLRDCDRTTSLWWRDIAALREHVSRVVGNGRVTRFWTDVWVGGLLFGDRFYRLFDLSLNKKLCVFDMCQLGWGRMERRGSGGVGCLLGRASRWGSSVYYFKL